MSRDIICPSCGFRNPAGLSSCTSCNFPFSAELRGIDADEEPTRAEASGASGVPTYAPRRALRRPPRHGMPAQGQSMWLWLLFGTFAAALLVWTAIDANRKRELPGPVEGSNADQQKLADAARAALAADSTDIDAQTSLANVLYDTANWSEAIVHYRAVLRRDSTRVAPMVDLGVCYYNLGQTQQAEALFRKALTLDAHQPIALFNMGIVSERRGNTEEALQYYHRAVENAPNEELKNAIFAAVQRTSQKAGKSPPPLPPAGGTTGGK